MNMCIRAEAQFDGEFERIICICSSVCSFSDDREREHVNAKIKKVREYVSAAICVLEHLPDDFSQIPRMPFPRLLLGS